MNKIGKLKSLMSIECEQTSDEAKTNSCNSWFLFAPLVSE